MRINSSAKSPGKGVPSVAVLTAAPCASILPAAGFVESADLCDSFTEDGSTSALSVRPSLESAEVSPT